MKKVIILQHNGGRLANQLWLFMSVYAYCLEKGYACLNYTFFEYGSYFNISSGSTLLNIFFFKPYVFFEKTLIPLRRYYRFLMRKIYNFFFASFIKRYKKNAIVFAESGVDSSLFYLPPSQTTCKEIINFDSFRGDEILYMVGWLFRNPVGIEKFRAEIKKYFRPKEYIIAPIEHEMTLLRKTYKKVIGVHMRQGDYRRAYKDGSLSFSENEVYGVLKRYVNEFHVDVESTCFVVFSDGSVNLDVFVGLHIFSSKNKTDIQDLFQLSMTDTIIGSDSTFGAFAAYYGNIPFIIFKKDELDWDYYRDKKFYFENKYSSVVRY